MNYETKLAFIPNQILSYLQVTASHSYIDPAEKDIACKVHEEEVVRFYCEPCETCICVLCTFQVGVILVLLCGLELYIHSICEFKMGIW